MFYAKNSSKKHLIFETWEHFENGQKWPPSKRYSLSTILTLDQKLKMQKNILKTFLQHIAILLSKKGLQKTPNIGKMRPFWKLPKMANKQRLLQNPHFGSKIKNGKKHAKNVSTTHCSCSMQKTFLIFDPKWGFCKGYSVWLVAIFGNFQNAHIFQILGVFWSYFLHTTTGMCCRNVCSMFFCIFNFWAKVNILQRL